MPKKTGTMKGWVTRNKSESPHGNLYNIHLKEPDFMVDRTLSGIWFNLNHAYESDVFEKHFFKLKPGAGPVEVEISIRKKKCK